MSWLHQAQRTLNFLLFLTFQTTISTGSMNSVKQYQISTTHANRQNTVCVVICPKIEWGFSFKRVSTVGFVTKKTVKTSKIWRKLVQTIRTRVFSVNYMNCKVPLICQPRRPFSHPIYRHHVLSENIYCENLGQWLFCVPFPKIYTKLNQFWIWADLV